MEFIIKNQKDKELINLIASSIKGTQWEGKVFLCGEYVRNSLLELPTSHIEICVESLNGHEAFANWICKEIGCFKINQNPAVFPKTGISFFGFKNLTKIADLRVKCTMTQSKLPEVKIAQADKTTYTTLNGDSFDRLITINALYVNISTMKIEDPTQKGLDDLENKVVRMIGATTYNFRTVPTRILQIIYEATNLGWGIDSQTWMRMIESCHYLVGVKDKYLIDEVTKILMLSQPSVGLRRMLHCGALAIILPPVHKMVGCGQGRSHFGDVFEHTLKTVDGVGRDFITRWAALLHDVAKPMVRQVINGKPTFLNHDLVGGTYLFPYLEGLGFDENSSNEICTIVKEHMRFKKNGLKAKPSNKSIKKFMSAIGDKCSEGKSLMSRILDVMHADNMAHAVDAQRPDLVPYIVDKILEFKAEEEKAKTQTTPLPLTGKDVTEWFSIKPSPLVGKILKYAQNIFEKNPTMSKNELLIELAKIEELIPVNA